MDDLWARNRQLLAERLKWPDGALEVAESIERLFPAYAVYWGIGRVCDPKPGWYAIRIDDAWPKPARLYGAQADDLIATLQADMARIARAKEALRMTKLYPWQ